MKFTFPKEKRLRKRSEYLQLKRAEERFAGKWILVDQRSNGTDVTRLGITVTRRYGNAYKRNRFKRVVREAFRLSQHLLPSGLDLNIRPRSTSHEASSTHIYEELLSLLKVNQRLETM